MENELVVLQEFSNETEAHIARGFLESCGIPSYVFGRGLHLRRYVIGADVERRARTKLMVRLPDLQKARELLKTPLKDDEVLTGE
ncbi:MAG: hypothetical protein ABII89_08910 [Candidatus Omnitrophota bacterium]